MNIPKFDGDFEKWIEYRDKFDKLVHSDGGLSGVQKFTFLEYSLTGPVSRLMDSLEVSGENYAKVWKKIRDKYDSPCEARSYHLGNLFDFKQLTDDSAHDLRRLIDEFNRHLAALKRLEVPTESWDLLVVNLLNSKLPPRIKKRWKLKFFLSKRAETLTEMMKFLEAEYKYLKRRDGKRGLNQQIYAMESYFAIGAPNYCPVCFTGSHSLSACKAFKRISPMGRVKLAEELEICLNCLRPEDAGHELDEDCKLASCEKCDGRHHELLHLTRFQLKSIDVCDRFAENFANFYTHHALRGTARLYAEDARGKDHSFRAFLSTGNEPNMMSKKLCDLLGLSLYPTLAGFTRLTNFMGGGKRNVSGYAEVTVKSRLSDYEKTLWFAIVDKLGYECPEPSVRLGSVEIPSCVTLADPHFDRPEPVDVVFGADAFGFFIEAEYIDKGDPDQPFWQNTVFGWIAAGNVRKISDSSNVEWTFVK